MAETKKKKKKGRKLSKGRVGRERIWLLPPKTFQSSNELEANVYPFLRVSSLQNSTILHVPRSAQLPCLAPLLEATSAYSADTSHSATSTAQEDQSFCHVENFHDAGIQPKKHPTQLREVNLRMYPLSY